MTDSGFSAASLSGAWILEVIGMRLSATVAALLVAVLTAACAEQPAAESAADAAAESASEEPSPTLEATEEPTEEPTDTPSPSPSAEPQSACDLVLADSDLPAGLTGSEPELETMDDLRAEVDAAEEGSPARAAAEANAAAFEEMGLVERCVRRLSGSPSGARLSSGALIFEDETGPDAYIDFLMEGCEAAEVSSDVTAAIVCAAGFPIAYLVVTDGAVAQSISAAPPDGAALDQEALLAEAFGLIEALPSP